MRIPLAAACTLLAAMPAFALWTYGTQDLAVESAPLRARTWLLRGQDGCQVVLGHGERAALLVDTLSSREQQHLLRAAAERLNGVPLRHIALTQHRSRTSAGLGDLPTNIQTMAHTDTAARWAAAGQAAPDLEFPGSLTVRLGGMRTDLWHKGAAHTAGALLVYFNEDQVLAVGDLITPGRHPEVSGGNSRPEGGTLRGWVQVLKQLQRDFEGNSEVLIVPARGGYGGLQLLQEQLDYLTAITDRAEAAWRNGLTREALLARIGPLQKRFADREGDLGPFLAWAYEQLGG